MPTTLPPKGAWAAKSARISLFERRVSSRRASTASFIFSTYVRGRFFRASRTTCIVIVLAPLSTFRARTFRRTARASASGSTPGWTKKRLSSNRTRTR